MKINLTRAGLPPSDNLIAEFASTVGHPLPGDYVDFLREENGGVTPCFVSIKGVQIQCFYSLREERSEGLFYEWVASRGFLPPEFLPIAFDITGEQVCLRLSDGTVFGMNEDTGEPVRMSASVGELLDTLREAFDPPTPGG